MQNEEFVKRKFPFIRLFRKIIFFIARAFPFLPGELRALLNKIGGVQIKFPMSTFIGYNVLFDDLFPENISIGKKTIITDGTKILAHFVIQTMMILIICIGAKLQLVTMFLLE